MKNRFKIRGRAGLGLGLAGFLILGASAPAADEWTLADARTAAANGNPKAEYFLALSYAHGQGVAVDNIRAAQYMRKSADNGYAPAEAALGSFYAHGTGVQQDLAEAMRWYRKAAAQGNALAEYCLGYACAYGQGEPKDIEQALKWWQQSAAQGEVYAENALGHFYLHGEGPGDTNHINNTASAQWLLKAARQDYVPAMQDLAGLYESGSGVKKDFRQALQWYFRAAELGDASAQDKLGLMFEDGHDGLPHDKVQAYKWFSLSAAEGNPLGRHDAMEFQLAHALTPEQIAQANAVVAEFLARMRTNQLTAKPQDGIRP